MYDKHLVSLFLVVYRFIKEEAMVRGLKNSAEPDLERLQSRGTLEYDKRFWKKCAVECHVRTCARKRCLFYVVVLSSLE